MPRSRALAIAAAERREREHEAEAALGRVHGAGGLHTSILALLRPDAAARVPLVWAAEIESRHEPATHDVSTHEPATRSTVRRETALLLAHAQALTPATRLPWLERLSLRMASQPVAARHRLLVSTRRLTGALGGAAPLDTLQWLALRLWLGEPSPTAERGAARHELADLPADELRALAHFCAFLSRAVCGPSGMQAQGHDAADAATGQRWFAIVMTPWAGRREAAFELPDTDRVLSALLGVQSLGWMQRPMLLRSWVDAAVRIAYPAAVDALLPPAADALRLTGALLDSPLPPSLSAVYRELPPD